MSDAYASFEVSALDDGLPVLVRDMIDRVIPLHANAGIKFDEIRVELWWDSGRVIAFPALRSSGNRIDKAGGQVISHQFLAQSETLMESEIDDEAFDNAVSALLGQMVDAIVRHLKGFRAVPFTIYDPDGNELYDGEQDASGTTIAQG